MEIAMLEATQWNRSTPRVELDHRARQARLQLEFTAQSIALSAAANTSLLRRILSRFNGVMVEDQARAY